MARFLGIYYEYSDGCANGQRAVWVVLSPHNTFACVPIYCLMTNSPSPRSDTDNEWGLRGKSFHWALVFFSVVLYTQHTHTHGSQTVNTIKVKKNYTLQSIIILHKHIIFCFKKRTAVDHCSISIISFDYPFRRPFLIHWANIFFVSPQPQLYSSLEGSQTLREKTILSPALDHTFLSHLFYYWVASLFSYWYSRQSVSIVIRRAVSFSSLLSASIDLSFSRPFI